MIPLLELPSNIIQENNSEFNAVIELYVARNFNELDKIVVTKNYDGSSKSYFGDEEWDFSAYIDRRITYKYKMMFAKIISDDLARELKLICFTWLYAAGHARKNAVIKPSTLFARYTKISSIYKFIENRGLDSIQALSSPIVFNEFCEYIKIFKYQYGQIAHLFSVLNHVSRASSILPIHFKLPTKKGSYQLAKMLSGNDTNKKNQFYAIPPRLMENIYKYCFNVIETYHPHKEGIHELLHDLRQNYVHGKEIIDSKIKSGSWKWLNESSSDYRIEVNKHKPSLYPDIINSHIEDTELENLFLTDSRRFQGQIVEIQTACFIVCGALTGMRRSELYCLHSNSFKQKELYGRKYYVLESEQHKMTQGRGVRAEWVTTEFTKKALELAEAISRHLRMQLVIDDDPMSVQNSTCLWLGQSKKSRKPLIRLDGSMRIYFHRIAHKANAYITKEDLEEFCLLNPNREPTKADQKLIVGKIWPLTAHQLRRTFAVFAKRHDLCHDIAIKQQFKHLDLPTTEWYGEGGLTAKALLIDTELKVFLDEAVQESTTQKIYDWYKGHETGQLMGHMAGSIHKNRIGLSKKYKSWDVIYEHVKEGRLNLVGTLHSYCMAGYECQMHKVSSPSNCMSCENQLIDKAQAENWEKRYNWACEKVKEMDGLGVLTSSMYSHFITQIRAAEKVLYRFKIPFIKFYLEGGLYEQIPIDES